MSEDGAMEVWLIQLERFGQDDQATLQRNEVIQMWRKALWDKLGKLTEFEEQDFVMLVDY